MGYMKLCTIASFAILTSLWSLEGAIASDPFSSSKGNDVNNYHKSLIKLSGELLAQTPPSPKESPQSSPSPKNTPSESPKSSPTITPSPTSTQTSSKIILQKNADLSPSKSSVLPADKSLYDQYKFEGNAGDEISISLESKEFDTYVAIFDEKTKTLLKEADDVGNCEYENDTQKKELISKGFCNSQMTITLPDTTTYLVIVNGREARDRGKYTLTIKSTGKK
ncbi:MAG: hypothetical protein RLZZ338_4007 [Cyanobacteriota bacterium]|jgi:hypothetical protein